MQWHSTCNKSVRTWHMSHSRSVRTWHMSHETCAYVRGICLAHAAAHIWDTFSVILIFALMSHWFWRRHVCPIYSPTKTHITHKSIWKNKSSVNPKSTSNQSSKPCTVLQYPSRKEARMSYRLWLTHLALRDMSHWPRVTLSTQHWETCLIDPVSRSRESRTHRLTRVTWLLNQHVSVWREAFLRLYGVLAAGGVIHSYW